MPSRARVPRHAGPPAGGSTAQRLHPRVQDSLPTSLAGHHLIDVFANLVKGRLARTPGYTAVQVLPGIGPVLGSVLVAEIGEIGRFPCADNADPAGPGRHPRTASPTPPSIGAGSPSRTPGWSAGRSWSPDNVCPPPPAWARSVIGSLPGAARLTVVVCPPAAGRSASVPVSPGSCSGVAPDGRPSGRAAEKPPSPVWRGQAHGARTQDSSTCEGRTLGTERWHRPG